MQVDYTALGVNFDVGEEGGFEFFIEGIFGIEVGVSEVL